jgi:hypothetical protein
MKRILIATLIAAGAVLSAGTASAGNIDENTLAGLYVPPSQKTFADQPVAASPIHLAGNIDENTLQGLYVPPSEKSFADQPSTVSKIVHYGDQNDLSWLPTAHG